MHVDGGANCHNFGENNLFCVSFVHKTPVQDAGRSTLWDDGVGLVPEKLLGNNTIHSLNPDYWTPQYRANTLSLSVLKLYSVFLGSSHEYFS